MFFDLKPKISRKDLFGLEYSLTNLTNALAEQSTRMVVIRGLRRMGKTSLLNVALNETKSDWVKVDVRESPFYDRKDFLLFLARKIEERFERPFMQKLIRSISGVGVSYQDVSLEVLFSKEYAGERFFSNLNDQLAQKDKQLILAFDEVQLLKKIQFDYVLASVFDNYGNITILLTGSEVGLVDTFLGKHDSTSPLFGRASFDIDMPRFAEEHMKAFLEEGCKQISKKVTFTEIKEVIEQLDGIIGWATHYGWLRSAGYSHEKSLQKVIEEGKELTKREIEQFLQARKAKAKYIRVLESISKNQNTWALIKYEFQKAKIKIADSQLQRYLVELMNHGFVQQESGQYQIADPLLLKALKQ